MNKEWLKYCSKDSSMTFIGFLTLHILAETTEITENLKKSLKIAEI